MTNERIEPGALVDARLMEMVFPGETNHYGTLFGGQALALMDKAAFIAASRYARRTVVTASSERIDFHVPVRQGQLVDLQARSSRPVARPSPWRSRSTGRICSAVNASSRLAAGS